MGLRKTVTRDQVTTKTKRRTFLWRNCAVKAQAASQSRAKNIVVMANAAASSRRVDLVIRTIATICPRTPQLAKSALTRRWSAIGSKVDTKNSVSHFHYY